MHGNDKYRNAFKTISYKFGEFNSIHARQGYVNDGEIRSCFFKDLKRNLGALGFTANNQIGSWLMSWIKPLRTIGWSSTMKILLFCFIAGVSFRVTVFSFTFYLLSLKETIVNRIISAG